MLEVAQKLIGIGLDDDQIKEATNLSLDEIHDIRKRPTSNPSS